LEKISVQDGFWGDQQKAQSVLKELSSQKKLIALWEKLKQDGDDLIAFLKMTDENNAGEMQDLKIQVDRLAAVFKEANLQLFLSDKYDLRDAILSISTGTGGTDAQDFSEMLLRMYLRYVEKKGYKVKILEKSEGAEAGIKSVTLEVRGEMAYGFLKGEGGVHRLIRLSPFNAKNLRQTSFSLVEVLPVLESMDEIKIDPQELRIDTFRASGAGGQHVNVTDSAIRITHLPTGIVTQCQNERSQLQNKEQALKILQAKLLKKQKEAEEKEEKKLKGEFKKIDFGNQIRTYTLHPYKLVKDHRTQMETGNVEGVLNGDIDEFIEANLTFC
jgi:peptide chain release factor 2